MKKLFTLSLGLLTFMSVITAQTNENLLSKKGEYYLPQQNDWSIGFQANDFLKYLGSFFGGENSAPEFMLINNMFIGKYMDTDKSAYRVIADLNVENHKDIHVIRSIVDREKEIKITESKNQFNFNIGVGREWRKGSTRLQGYYGADAFLGVSRNSDEHKKHNPNNPGTADNPVDYEHKDKSGLGFLIGARGFLGTEYFVLPKMALGAEYSYSISLNTVGEGTITETGKDTKKNGKKRTEFYLGGENKSYSYGTISLKLSLYF